MKIANFGLFLVIGYLTVPSIAQADDVSLMCDSSERSENSAHLMCTPEQYGFTYNQNSGQFSPLPPALGNHVGPTISEASDSPHRRAPRDVLGELETLTGSPFGGAAYGAMRSIGASHEDSMNAGRAASHIDEIGGAHRGRSRIRSWPARNMNRNSDRWGSEYRF
jgi:hypothetical protein